VTLPTASASRASSEGRFPPAIELVTVSLAAVVIGGITMASYGPKRPSLGLPVALLVVAALALAAGCALLARVRDFAWGTFRRFGRWALLAYVVSAGLIEFAFVRNDTRGAPLVVVTLMLVVFALDVTVLIAGTVAKHDRLTPAQFGNE